MLPAYSNITVFFNASPEGLRVLAKSGVFASIQKSHLIGVTSMRYDTGFPEESFSKGDVIIEVIKKHRRATAGKLLELHQGIQDISVKLGVQTELRVIPSTEDNKNAIQHALYSDLVIFNYPCMSGLPEGMTISSFLSYSGLPIIVVPDSWQGEEKEMGRKVTIAWNGSRQAWRAVSDSLAILVNAEEVQLLIVDAHQSQGIHGEDPGTDMAAYLARHGVRIDLVNVESDRKEIAEVILEHTVTHGSDLLVIGAWSRPRLSELILGGTTNSLFKKARLPLFISR
ncbi:universal stress protein [Kosakonia sp. S42]|uniref:universal stress protein n=1 Tax=Kosakonia sp. S42 TaxID=2767458 RepID=UPI00190D76BC|nr:universal stress protein [Kosakonia sp. S42]MBK0019481.1 universal stress protein [Kosakonia sp. S42]